MNQLASSKATHLVLWTLITVYAYSRILQVFPGRASMLEVVALHVIPPLLFALIHGTSLYRLRGSIAFILICLVIGNVFENLGVRTGFPYGHYYFTDVMGPKIFVVPIFLGLAYIGMAYLSWTLASIILGTAQTSLRRSRVFTIPLLAAFVMTTWDLAMDPGSTPGLGSAAAHISACPSPISWAGISSSTSFINSSLFTCARSRPNQSLCRSRTHARP